MNIKPDSYPSSINLGSSGVVPVVIFGFAEDYVGNIATKIINFDVIY